jgi:hypothetical protein
MQIGTKQETVIRRVVATHRVRFDVRRFKDVFGFPSTDSASSVVQMQQSFPERSKPPAPVVKRRTVPNLAFYRLESLRGRVTRVGGVFGGPCRVRTDDLRIKSPMLYSRQLEPLGAFTNQSGRNADSDMCNSETVVSGCY